MSIRVRMDEKCLLSVQGEIMAELRSCILHWCVFDKPVIRVFSCCYCKVKSICTTGLWQVDYVYSTVSCILQCQEARSSDKEHVTGRLSRTSLDCAGEFRHEPNRSPSCAVI